MVKPAPHATPLPLQHELIRASAGTGKTFRLSNRYLLLLAAGVEPAAILATTFSRKGAGEILDRIVQRLSAAALDDGAAERLTAELRQDLGDTAGDWQLGRERAANLLQSLLRQLHRLEVSTLDSFFHRVAKVFSLELGLPPTWEIVEQQQMLALEDEAIQGVLAEEGADQLLPLLSHGEATRRVATMIRDLVRDIYGIFRDSGIEPWQRFQATGQRLTDEERWQLAEAMLAIQAPQKSINNLVEKLVAWVRDDDWKTLVDQTVIANVMAGNFKYGKSQLPEPLVPLLQRLCDHLRAVVSANLVIHNRSTAELLQAFGQRLEQSKSATGSLRFEDVTERLMEFVGALDADRLAFRLDHQIQHLLLDEFQDTSPAQWKVLRPLAQRVTAEPAGTRSFFCVGDMKQAIFGWRGGVAEIFDVVQQEVKHLHEDSLSLSYRSAPPVIETVNRVFQRIGEYQGGDAPIQQAIQQWPQWFREHRTAREELAGYVTLETADQVPSGNPVSGHDGDEDPDPLVAAAVRRVADLDRRLPEDCSIGVLVRTNKEVAQLIFRLREAGVLASEEGGNPLTDAAGVELILSALQLADHPGDSVTRFHVSHSPLAAGWGLLPENPDNQNDNATAAHRGAAELRRRLMEEGYGPVVESLARQLVKHATRREAVRLQQLIRVAYDVGAGETWHLRPRQFVESVREEIRVADASAARVRVMTIHQCKGLEFDAVVFPCPSPSKGWAGQAPPVVVGRSAPTGPIEVASNYVGSSQRQFLPESLEELVQESRQRTVREALCVLYVALTRAAHALHIIVPEGQQPDKQGPAALLMATLAEDPLPDQGPVYQLGDPDWYRTLASPQVEADPWGLNGFYLPAQLELGPAQLQRKSTVGRGWPHLSPSSAGTADAVQLADVISLADHSSAQQRGQMLHACFESVTWLDRETLDRQALVERLGRRWPGADEAGDAVDEFLQLVRRPAMTKLFSELEYQRHYLAWLAPPDDLGLEALRVEIDNERPFAVWRPGGLLRGVIDRLVVVYQGDQAVAADVIEIKTDEVGDAIHAKVQRYRQQVTLYREAVAQWLGLPLERVAGRLVFVTADQVVNLSLPDLEESGAVRSSPAPQPSRPTRRAAPRSRQRKLWED